MTDAPAPPSHRGPGHAHDFLAPAFFALIGEVRRTQDRVAATSGRGATADPEAIHDFRVALRRLRTVLRPARPVFGKRRLREIGAELRRFAQVTGSLRDEEVLRETLGALALPPRPKRELDAWLAQRAKQERVRRRGVAAFLLAADSPDGSGSRPGLRADKPRYAQGPSLGAALAHLERRVGRRRRADLLVTALAEAALARAFADVQVLAGAPPREAAAMHALRIRFKRLRYTADLFAPVLGDRGAVLAKASARMQKRLGELHDIDEALVRVARARGLSPAAARAVRRALLRARREVDARAREALGEELTRIAAALPVR